MTDSTLAVIGERRRSNWVRLRTMVLLRWITCVGQISAILVAVIFFELDISLVLCFLAVGGLFASNLFAELAFSETRRLSENELLGLLLFDVFQLSGLLYLTGGLNNPFALLILAPVAISATTLNIRATALIGISSVTLISFVALWHVPLLSQAGYIMRMPPVFVFGFWTALTIGIGFVAIYARRITSELNSMAEALAATQMALAREQKLNELVGVVAATAHELGTPLATIKMTSAELRDEIDRPDWRNDAELIHAQADRCRDILHRMGQADRDDWFDRHVPLSSAIEEAAAPHANRGINLVYAQHCLDTPLTKPPQISLRPEIVHSLRNLIQNAVDFAETTVWIDIEWSQEWVSLRIKDDGPGFAASTLPYLGEALPRRALSATSRLHSNTRPEGMGLGIFIARTLLERTGAELTLTNNRDAIQKGACAIVRWPRRMIEEPLSDTPS